MVFTDGTSYTVKRIRRNAQVELARCDVRGKVLGPWHRATCRTVENEPNASPKHTQPSLTNTGFLMRLGAVFATIAGRVRRRLMLELSL